MLGRSSPAPHSPLPSTAPGLLLTDLLISSSLQGQSPGARKECDELPQNMTDLEGSECHLFPHFRKQNLARAKWSRAFYSICFAGLALEVTAGDRSPRRAPSAFPGLPRSCPLGPLTFYSVFLSLKMDRELGAAVQERACSLLQLHRGCNTIMPAPYPHRYLFIHTGFLLVFIKLGRKG